MQFVIGDNPPEQKTITLEHNGEQLSFKGGAWPAIKRPELVFSDINNYWNDLPPNTQNSIWEVYKKLAAAFDEIKYINRLHIAVRQLIAELMNLMPFEQMLYHINNKAKIKYPLDLKDKYDRDAPQGALTYLRSEYIELVALLLMLRPLVPILGQYVTNAKDDVGNNHKEYQAGILLVQSKVVDAAPFKRLQQYIEAYLGDTGPMLAANLGGITTANFPVWLFYTTLIKKLAALELATTFMDEIPTNIMSKVYNHIRAVVEQPDRLIQGKLYDKATSAAESGAEDDNTSRIEGVKVREQVSEGDRVSLEFATEQTVKFTHRIDCTVPVDLIALCYDHIVADSSFQPDEYKFWLTAWVLCGDRVMVGPQGRFRGESVISPKALTIMRYESQVSAFAAAQAILWHHGFYDLAMLISDRGTPITFGTMVSAGITKLDKNMIEALGELYPMSPVPKNKKNDRVEAWPNTNVEALHKQAIANCIAIKEIDHLIKTISGLTWAKSGPKGLAPLTTLQNKGEYTMITADIKNQLARFILASKIL